MKMIRIMFITVWNKRLFLLLTHLFFWQTEWSFLRPTGRSIYQSGTNLVPHSWRKLTNLIKRTKVINLILIKLEQLALKHSGMGARSLNPDSILNTYSVKYEGSRIDQFQIPDLHLLFHLYVRYKNPLEKTNFEITIDSAERASIDLDWRTHAAQQ